MNTACSYIRGSTDNQVKYSLDAQLNAIKKYTKENNLILPSKYIFIYDGYSGRKSEKNSIYEDDSNDKVNKTLRINEEDAKIVKYIFNEFLNSTTM